MKEKIRSISKTEEKYARRAPDEEEILPPCVQKTNKPETSLTPWVGSSPSTYGVILAAFFISPGLNVLVCEIRAV